jgi:hypothetical protein
MIILLDQDGKRFRTASDEWWVMANWNKDHVLVFQDRATLNRYCTKHAILQYRAAEVDSIDLPPSSNVRLRKPIEVEFDMSNGQHYVYVAMLHFYDPSADEKLTANLDVQVFTNLGGAQAFYKHMGEKGKDWYIENPSKSDQCWSLDLDPSNPHKAYKVTLHELLLVKR